MRLRKKSVGKKGAIVRDKEKGLGQEGIFPLLSLAVANYL